MPYSLIQLIEIITKLISDQEMQFVQEYEEEGFTPRQIEYVETINKLGNPNLGRDRQGAEVKQALGYSHCG